MGMCIYTRGGVVDPLSEEKRVRREEEEEEVGPFRDVAWLSGVDPLPGCRVTSIAKSHRQKRKKKWSPSIVVVVDVTVNIFT